MIKIDKPEEAPEVLKTKGKKKRSSHYRSYSRSKAKYKSGERTFEFDNDIYGHKTVKETLKDSQHGKCCFCESKVQHIAYGDVEHYRPKAGYRQDESDGLHRPGYYWLAYDWDNLFFACQLCNQRHKRNLFPLKVKSKRAKWHKDDIENEETLFVNPAADDPEEYIKFREEVAYPVNGRKQGKVTIESLALNRIELLEYRKKKYEIMRSLSRLVKISSSSPEREDAQRLLEEAKNANSEYSSMMRCAMEAGFE